MSKKEDYQKKYEEKIQRHPIRSQRLISFILGTISFVISLALVATGVWLMTSGGTITASVATLVVNVAYWMFLQLSIIFNAFAINSTNYAFHCTACTFVGVTAAIEIGLVIYYFIILI